jgi:hypothetical protein
VGANVSVLVEVMKNGLVQIYFDQFLIVHFPAQLYLRVFKPGNFQWFQPNDQALFGAFDPTLCTGDGIQNRQ